eukprot:g347.t1
MKVYHVFVCLWVTVFAMVLTNVFASMEPPVLLQELLDQVLQQLLQIQLEDTYRAYAYRDHRWIEQMDHALVGRTSNSAIAFSGGGARAFVTAMGQLKGLRDIGVLERVRYITGISGGGWATMSYAYHTTPTDAFLSDIVAPENLTFSKAKEPPEKSAAYGFATANFVEKILEHVIHGIGAYDRALQDIYLSPAGIQSDAFLAWNASTRDASIRRQKEGMLDPSQFALVPQNDTDGRRPYPIIGATLLAPAKYGSDTCNTARNYTLLEFSPLYVGPTNPNTVEMTYVGGLDKTKTSAPVTVGGSVESFAFGGSAPSSALLPANAPDGILDMPIPEKTLTLQRAIATGGWAPGAFIGTHWILPNSIAAIEWPYWSPAASSPSAIDQDSEIFTLADGGCFENIHLIGLVARGVTNIIVFENSEEPLQGADHWNASAGVYPEAKNMGIDIPAFFGVAYNTQSTFDNCSWDYTRDQIFRTEDFFRVAADLQRAQKGGNGVLARSTLTTVENSYWGIDAGTSVNVTWSYLSRIRAWEDLLPEDMLDRLVPHAADARADPSQTVQSGEFKGFPNYATTVAGMSNEKASVLYNLAGWVMRENAALVRQALGLFSA